MSKIVSFLGTERCDVIHYLGILGKRFGKTILIVDNSTIKDMIQAFPRMDNSRFIATEFYSIVSSMPYDEKVVSGFDIVLVYHGSKPNAEWLKASNEAVVMTTYSKLCVTAVGTMVREQIMNFPEENYLLCRDKLNNKISEHEIVDAMPKNIRFAEKMIVSLDLGDAVNYQAFGYNAGKQAIKGCSSEMLDALTVLGVSIYEDTEKNVKKALRK